MNLSEEELKRIFKHDRYAELSNIELLTKVNVVANVDLLKQI